MVDFFYLNASSAYYLANRRKLDKTGLLKDKMYLDCRPYSSNKIVECVN